jgi:hypothetical protein
MYTFTGLDEITGIIPGDVIWEKETTRPDPAKSINFYKENGSNFTIYANGFAWIDDSYPNDTSDIYMFYLTFV